MAQLIKITYSPEGGSRQTWEIDLTNPAWDLHKAAPKAARIVGWMPFAEALLNIDADAWQAMIWALRRRKETRLSFDAVEFPSGLLNEIDFAAQCPDCGDWATTEDDAEEHVCAAADEPEDGQPEGGPGEA